MVSSLLSRQEFYAVQSEQFVEETFDGSLLAFIAAFTQKKTLSQEEATEIRHMIDRATEKERVMGVIFLRVLNRSIMDAWRKLIPLKCPLC